MTRLLAGLGIVALLGLVPAKADAAPVLIDFGSATYAGANGVAAFGVVDQGILVSLSGNGLLTQDGDGIGISDDEVSNFELLVSGLSPASFLTEIYIAKLFPDEGLFGYDENGSYSLNGGAWVPFSSNGTSSLTVPVNLGGVAQIRFRTANNDLGFDFGVSDYSVRGLLLDVPEPFTTLLFGVGLLGAGAAAARRRARATK